MELQNQNVLIIYIIIILFASCRNPVVSEVVEEPTESEPETITEEQAEVIIGLCEHYDSSCGFLQDDMEKLLSEVKQNFPGLS